MEEICKNCGERHKNLSENKKGKNKWWDISCPWLETLGFRINIIILIFKYVNSTKINLYVQKNLWKKQSLKNSEKRWRI